MKHFYISVVSVFVLFFSQTGAANVSLARVGSAFFIGQTFNFTRLPGQRISASAQQSGQYQCSVMINLSQTEFEKYFDLDTYRNTATLKTKTLFVKERHSKSLKHFRCMKWSDEYVDQEPPTCLEEIREPVLYRSLKLYLGYEDSKNIVFMECNNLVHRLSR